MAFPLTIVASGGGVPRPVIHLLELLSLSFQTATFAEFRLARERVGYGDEGPLFRRAHGVPLNLGANAALRAKTVERPLDGLIFSHPPLP